LRALGELTFTAGETPVAGAPDLNLISNVGRSTPPRSVFHTDTSYVARPPAFTALRAVRLPRAGGTTLFSDQVRAAATLPARIRAALSGRTVRHGLAATGAEGSQRHPLFRRHPVTSEVALFLSTPERCTELSGVDRATSERAIDALYRHSIRPTRLYRHTWRAGDIVIWDDRLTMHRADHTDVDGDRVLHRGLVLGEVPIPA
jgi:taurine dioxygenase